MKDFLLYNLVHSLTKNEKGYFVKQLSSTNTPYLKLFKLIAEQKKYDEAELKRRFKQSYIGANLPFAKNYLYHAILKSLIQFGAVNKDNYYYFSVIQILYEKGLYDQSAKMLKLVMKKASKANDYLSILRIIQYAKLILHSNFHADDRLEEIINREGEIIEKQQAVSTFQSILVKVNGVRLKTGALKDKRSIKELNAIKKHSYLQDKSKIIDLYCEQMYHEILFLCGFLLEDSELARSHIEPLERFIVDSSNLMSGYQKVDVLKQVIRFHTFSADYPAAAISINALKEAIITSDINASEREAAYTYYYISKTNLLLIQKKFDEAQEIFNEIDSFFYTNKKTIPEEYFVLLTGNLVLLRFMMGDYKESARLVNIVLTSNRQNLRKDILIYAMLTELILIYELKKIELFQSRLKGFNRHIATHGIKEKTWKIFSNFLNKIEQGHPIQVISEELLSELTKLPPNHITQDLDFLKDWLKLKINSN